MMNIAYLKSIQTSHHIGYLSKTMGAKREARDEYNQRYLRRSYNLYFPKEIGGYTYADYLKDVEQFYLSKGHYYSEELALVFTFFFICVQKVTNNTNKALEKLNNCFTRANLHMVFPMRLIYQEEKILHLENFMFGKFQVQDVKNIIKRNIPTTDYWERFIKHNQLNERLLQDSLAIQRRKEEVQIYNPKELDKYLPDDLLDYAFDMYFETLSELKRDEFWDEFSKDLADAVAFGMAFYDKRIFYDLGLGEGTLLTMFTHIAGIPQQGWIIPIKPRLDGIQYGCRKDVEHVNQSIKIYHEMRQWGESEFLRFYDVLKSFTTTATIHLQDDRPSDAFINLTAGLDAVLNSDSEVARSNTLKNRMAILTFNRLGVEFKKHYFAMKELYDLRSQFVHAGIVIDRDKVNELFAVVEQVMNALLQMHQLYHEGEYFTLGNWFQDMDSLINDAHNKRPLEKELMEDIGALALQR